MTSAPLPRPESGSHLLDPSELEWEATDTDGFWIKPLLADADGGTTSLMKIDAGAFAEMHSHDQLEEIVVLDGEFSDQNRTYTTGQYCVRAIDEPHTAGSVGGCTVLLVYRP